MSKKFWVIGTETIGSPGNPQFLRYHGTKGKHTHDFLLYSYNIENVLEEGMTFGSKLEANTFIERVASKLDPYDFKPIEIEIGFVRR